MEDLMSGQSLTPEVSSVLHSVFLSCDENEDGFVSVSKLITFLKEKANGSEVLNFLDELTPILDVEGDDPSIDWDTCHAGLQEWIQYVHNKSIHNISTSSITTSSPSSKSSRSPNKMPSPLVSSTPANYIIERITNVSNSSTYSNDSIDCTDLSWDQSDVQVKLEELEITNKRLLEDNFKLKTHLHSTEDQNSMVLQENDQLKSNLVKCEKLLEESKKVFKSHEELKMTVVEYQNLKNDLINKTCQLEKENNSLQQAVAEYESRISKLDSSLEVIKEEKLQLKHEVSLQKNLLSQIEDLKTSKECVVEESANKSEYMSSLIAELSLANEVLKAQKNNIENELSEMKQDVCRMTIMSTFNSVHSSTPLLSSTRYDKPSIDQEIRAEMNNSTGTYDANESLRHHFDFSDVSDNSSPPCSPKTEKYSHIAQQCRKKFKEKKEVVFTKIEEIVNRQENTFDGNKTALIVKDLNRELESFTEKIAEFAQGKQTAEKRALKLAAALKKLKGETKGLEESRDKALQRYGDLSITSQETQRKLEAVTEELEQQKRAAEELQAQPESLVPRDDVSVQCSLVEVFETRNCDCSRMTLELEEMLAVKSEKVLQQKKTIENLEQQLFSLETHYSSELQTILSIIPYHDDNTKLGTIIRCVDVKEKLLNYINSSIHESNKLLGVRESPDGGSHYADNTIQTDELNYIKQQYSRSEHNNNSARSRNNNKEWISSASQTDTLTHVATRSEISTQTDLDMLAMNKIIDSCDLLSHENAIHSNIPSRLLKRNSIDFTEVAIETISDTLGNSSCPSSIVEEDILNPVNENVLNTINEDFVEIDPTSSQISSHCSSRKASQTFAVTVTDTSDQQQEHMLLFDENNNKKSPETSMEESTKDQDKTSDGDCEQLDDDEKSKIVNLTVAKLIEYDRSDISSDSDVESKEKAGRRISIGRSKRNRMNRRRSRNSVVDNESLIEEPTETSGQKDLSDSSNGSSSKQRRRRMGVSAEPVRVSWSTLRESFKQQQQQMSMYTGEDIAEETGNEHKETDQDSISTQDICASDISAEDQLNVVPSIEIEDHESNDGSYDMHELKLSNEQISLLREAFPQQSSSPKSPSPKSPLSPKSSLQIPSFRYDANSLANLNDSEISCRSYIDDKELEKKFNNIIFSFKTDQYTLQKRLEHQERARDVSESGMDKEIAKLSTAIQDLRKYEKGSSEFLQVYSTLCKQSDVLRKAAMKISAQSEQHGCYQQEHRMSPCIEVVIKYADILRFNMNKLKSEMHIYRQRLESSNVDSKEYSFSTAKESIPAEPNNSEVSNKTQEQVGETIEDAPKEVADTASSSPRRSFVSISKSLLAAQGMLKLRQRKQNSETSIESVEQLSSEDVSPVKKSVSFGEASTNDESFQDCISDMGTQPSLLTTLSQVALPHKVKEIALRILIAFLLFAIFYIVVHIIANSLEVDTIRLHDKLLKFIPHTIEPAEKSNLEER